MFHYFFGVMPWDKLLKKLKGLKLQFLNLVSRDFSFDRTSKKPIFQNKKKTKSHNKKGQL